jgi:arylsulfatase A-like enzyme
LLKQEQGYPAQRSLYWHFPNHWGPKGPGIGPSSTIRQGDWKLIYYHADSSYELFNLAADLGEQRNLAASEPEIRERLAGQLARFLASVDAQMPTVRASGEMVALPDGTIARSSE